MKKILSMIMLVICLMVTGISTVMADTLPPTSISDDELAELKAMTLKGLQKVAKEMPDSATYMQEYPIGTFRSILHYSLIPEDGNIYHIRNVTSVLNKTYDVYYKFIYVSPAERNTITYHIYKWDYTNGKLNYSGQAQANI